MAGFPTIPAPARPLVRRWRAGLLCALMALVVAGTVVALHALNTYAEDRQDASLVVVRLSDVAAQQAFLAWQLSTGAVAGDLTGPRLAALRDQAGADLGRLRDDGIDQRDLRAVDAAFGAYDRALTAGLGDASAGRIDLSTAHALSVLAAYETLHRTVDGEQAGFDAQASRAQLVRTAGGAALIAAAFVTLGLLMRGAWRRRERDAVLRAEATALRDSERSFRLLFKGSPHPMWVYSPETLAIAAVNHAALAHYGYSYEEFRALRAVDVHLPEEAAAAEADLRARCDGGRHRDEWRHRLRDGRVIDVELTSDAVEFRGEPSVVITAQDVSERRRLEEQLRHRAFHDPLTGLANRALFADRAEQALARARRTGTGCAVLLLDLDDFKTVNDSLGHGAGDGLLTEVAARLAPLTRPGDTLARLGGDEFAVMVEDLADGAQVTRVAERILAAVRHPFALAGREVHVSASVGIAVAETADGVTPEDLLRDADVAMYDAKRAGGGRWSLFGEAMSHTVHRRLELRAALAGAAGRGELEVHYQPVVDLRSGRCKGVESLVRWQHPVRGLILPGEFIPLAVESGHIVGLDRHVLRETVRHVARWEVAAGGGRFTASVNVTFRDLLEDDFVDAVLGILDAEGVAPDRLVLEITESTFMRDGDRTLRKLVELRRHGVRLAMDDFGTGYSSLTYLRTLPLDIVKVDRSFISGIAQAARARSLTLAIVRLLGTLDVETVAEGIETQGQLEYVEAMGCDQGQGLLFSAPLTAAGIDDYLAGRRTAAVPGRPGPEDRT